MIVGSNFYKDLVWLAKFCQKGTPFAPYRTVQIVPTSETEYCLSIFDGWVEVCVFGSCLNAEFLTFDLYDLLKAAKVKDEQIVLSPGYANGGEISVGETISIEAVEYQKSQEVFLDFSWLALAADRSDAWTGVWLKNGFAYGLSRTRLHAQRCDGEFNFCMDDHVAKNLPTCRMMVEEGDGWAKFSSVGWSVRAKVGRLWNDKTDELIARTNSWEKRRISAPRLKTVLKDPFFNDYVNLLIYENLSVECKGKMLVVDLEERGEFKGSFKRKQLIDALGTSGGKVVLRYSDTALLRIDHDDAGNKFAIVAGM